MIKVRVKKSQEAFNIKRGEEFEAKKRGYDPVFKQDVYQIIGKSFFLPLEDLTILK